MSRYRYSAEGISMARLRSAFGGRRHFNNLKSLLEELGKYCFRTHSDGVFRMAILRFLPLSSHPRTVLYSHFPALLECGAIEPCGSDDEFHIVGFVEHNMSAREIEERALQRREDNAAAKRRERARRYHFTECTHSMKAQPDERAFSDDYIAVSGRCQPQPTEATRPEADLSATNRSLDLQTQPEVDSPTEEDLAQLSPDLAVLVKRAEAKAHRHAQTHAIPEEEIAAVERELAGNVVPQAAWPSSQPARRSKPAPYPVRLARKPKRRTPVNEHYVAVALGELQVSLTSEGQRAWCRELLASGISGEDLEYAVREVRRQQGKQGIRDRLAYAQKIVLSQAQARRALLT